MNPPQGELPLTHRSSHSIFRAVFGRVLLGVLFVGLALFGEAQPLVEANATPPVANSVAIVAQIDTPVVQTQPVTPSTSTQTAQAAPRQATRPAKATSCQVAPFALPAQPAVAPGTLTLRADAPTYYTLTTNTTDGLVTDVHQCALQQPTLGGFDAKTYYNMSWSYDVATAPDGTCHLTGVWVGIHISQLFPAVSSTNSAVAPYINPILSKLYSHENQHVSIDKQQATNLYNQLVSLQASCDAIWSTASNVTSVAVSALSAANADLDATTAHGTR